jgi:hypothetical protein
MHVRTTALALALAAISTTAHAQQDHRPTLLILCDRACDWTLDADTKGHIAPGHSTKLKVESGQHILVVDDGEYTLTTNNLTIKATGQTLQSFEFQPLHDADAGAAQAAADAQAAAQAEAAREAQARANEAVKAQAEAARVQAIRDAAAEAARQPWTDPETGLMWTKTGSGADLAYRQAYDYCTSLRLAGYSDWRMPSPDEWHDMQNLSVASGGGTFLRGGLDVGARWAWTNTYLVDGKGAKQHPTGQAYAIDTYSVGESGWQRAVYINGRDDNGQILNIRTLCVRGASTR